MSAHQHPAGSPLGPPARPETVPCATTGLSFAGMAADGTLLLTDGDGATFSLTVDARVRAALAQAASDAPEQASTPARREPPMETQSPSDRRHPEARESALRPRDIQARIRAGESPEQVAATAQTSVEKVMPFAGPVLAEREHIAERAQKSSVRRPTGAPVPESGARTLGDVVESRLRRLNVDPTDLVAWDAWRREDGRWSLTGRYAVSAADAQREGLAEFTFDTPGNFVTLDNDDARWLVGDLPDAPPPAVEVAPTGPAPRRLAAVQNRPVEPPVRADADQLSIDDALGLGAESPVEAYLDDPAEPTDEAPHEEESPEPPRRRPVRKNRGRASVPSWDEIMFGGPSD